MGIMCILAASGYMTPSQAQQTEQKKELPQTISFKERWAIQTNALDWALLMPNIGVEYDLSNSIYNRWAVGAKIRWNGPQKMNTQDRIQLKMNDYRLEAKRYFKPSMHTKSGSFKKTPKFWRTYYWGLYAGYTEYALAWNTGVEGKLVHLGATGGCQIQIYRLKQGGSLDLDLGLSLGLGCADYNKYEYENNQMNLTKSQSWKVLPYPLLTDLRVGFVYRFKSVRQKYGLSKHK